MLYLLALYEGVRLGRMDAAALGAHIAELDALPAKIAAQLDGWRAQMAALAAKYKTAATFLYLGRGIHYAIAREGALKLKEASYVHAEGYPAGELKHGPNALVSERVPLVVLATVDRGLEASVLRYEKTVQLLRDMRAQGARVIALANAGDAEVAALASDCVAVEPGSEYLLPVAEVVPLQLFAYYMALEHGVDVDRPRICRRPWWRRRGRDGESAGQRVSKPASQQVRNQRGCDIAALALLAELAELVKPCYQEILSSSRSISWVRAFPDRRLSEHLHIDFQICAGPSKWRAWLSARSGALAAAPCAAWCLPVHKRADD